MASSGKRTLVAIPAGDTRAERIRRQLAADGHHHRTMVRQAPASHDSVKRARMDFEPCPDRSHASRGRTLQRPSNSKSASAERQASAERGVHSRNGLLMPRLTAAVCLRPAFERKIRLSEAQMQRLASGNFQWCHSEPRSAASNAISLQSRTSLANLVGSCLDEMKTAPAPETAAREAAVDLTECPEQASTVKCANSASTGFRLPAFPQMSHQNFLPTKYSDKR